MANSSKQDVECKICKSRSQYLFEATVLNKYLVNYFQCGNCKFIQTEEPYWLNEAYSDAITKLDIGLIGRNLHFAEIVKDIVINSFDVYAKFLDYGGGYGMFVRLMRDKGFHFYRQDIYCENIFAEHFDIKDLPGINRFEVLTCFEVFEHLSNPVNELEKMLTLSDNIIFSTELQSVDHPTPETWWYFVPETGQHIGLYSRKSLEVLANHFKLNFYSNNASLHVFSKMPLKKDPFKIKKKKLFGIIPNRKKSPPLESLLMKDFEFVRKKLNT